MAACTSLPSKLHAVLWRLQEKMGGSLTVAQALTLPYLVDVVAQHVLGRTITEGTHICVSDEEYERACRERP